MGGSYCLYKRLGHRQHKDPQATMRGQDEKVPSSMQGEKPQKKATKITLGLSD